MSSIFVGRQPIYNAQMETFAYELLFRSGNTNKADFVDGNHATAELLINTFAEIGLERIVGTKPAFINVPENFLLNGHASVLPQERVVLEILEDVRPTVDVLLAIRQLRDEGYTIAIDDFVYSEELLPLVELADIVKVEIPAIDPEDLETHVNLLRDHNVKILAEKVETEEVFQHCKSLEFDYYQGYFFCRPTVVQGTQLPTNRITMMRLIAQLQSQSVRSSEISGIIRTEPALSFKLLRFVNSACCGLSHKIESIQHAVAIAGIQRIRTLAYLSIMTTKEEARATQLIQTVLTRARMSELLGQRLGQVRTDSFFLVGLFSAVDALLNVPLDEALELVSLSNEVQDALSDGEGKLGTVLNCVLEYEKGNWEGVKCFNLEATAIRDAYLDSITWVETILNDKSFEEAEDDAKLVTT